MTNDGSTRYVIVGVTPGQPEPVLEHAARFARHFGATLVCANVDPGSYVVKEHPDGSVSALSIDPDLPETTRSATFDPRLADHVHRVLGHEVHVIFRALAGERGQALARLAQTLQAEMIVVGSRHPGFRSSVTEYLGGSVAVHLAHRQHLPVVVIPVAPVPIGQDLPWEGHDAP